MAPARGLGGGVVRRTARPSRGRWGFNQWRAPSRLRAAAAAHRLFRVRCAAAGRLTGEPTSEPPRLTSLASPGTQGAWHRPGETAEDDDEDEDDHDKTRRSRGTSTRANGGTRRHLPRASVSSSSSSSSSSSVVSSRAAKIPEDSSTGRARRRFPPAPARSTGGSFPGGMGRLRVPGRVGVGQSGRRGRAAQPPGAVAGAPGDGLQPGA